MKRNIKIAIAGLCSALCVGGGLGLLLSPVVAEETPQNKKSDIFTCFAVEEVVDGYEIPAYAAHSSTIGTESSDTGIAMFTSSGSASFTYNNPIRVDGLTEETNLIEMFALAKDGLTGVNTIKITLTDVENEANTFSVRYYVHTNGSPYCFLEYQGRTIAWSSETANYLWQGGYGAWVPGVSFNGNANNGDKPASDNSVVPFSIWLNYAEKQVFCNYGTRRHMLMDLDDVAGVGKGGVWEGFESGMVKLSVAFELNQAKRGGIYVKSIVGYNLDGGFENEDSYAAPSITYLMPKAYQEEMPVGGVGVAYAIPEIYANDWYFGKCAKEDIAIQVFNKAGQDVSSQISDGYFTATETGVYKIRYTASNPQKSTTDELVFKVTEDVLPIVITPVSDFTSSELLTQTTIPSIEIFGGSGLVSVEERLYYNGEEVEINAARSLFLDKAGAVSLQVRAKGYTGEEVVKYFTLVVEENTVLSVQNMPMVLQSMTQVVFPAPVAYNSANKEAADTEILVDGVKLGADRKYTVEKESGSVTVVYKASTEAYGEKEKSFVIPVVNSITLMPSDLMRMKSGEMDIQDSSTAIHLATEQSFSEAYWAYPVATGNASVNAILTISGLTVNNAIEKNAYDYIDVTYANYANTTETMFLRIYKDCDAGKDITYMQVNGVGPKYLIDGNLGVPNLPINLYIDTASGYVYDAVKYTPICTFDSYKADVSVVGIRFGNVSGEAAVSLIQLSNQRMSSTPDWYDNNMPVISFSEKMSMNMEVKRGEYIQIPESKAYDMLSDNATITLKVVAPDGKVVLETEDVSKGAQILAEQTGYYRAQFIAQDFLGNKDTLAIYNYYAYDNVAPTLTIEGSIQKTLKQGSTVIVPNATASDNANETCSVFVYLRSKGDYNDRIVELGSKITFNKSGEYELVYVTHDSDYNYMTYVMTVTVEEVNNG